MSGEDALKLPHGLICLIWGMEADVPPQKLVKLDTQAFNHQF